MKYKRLCIAGGVFATVALLGSYFTELNHEISTRDMTLSMQNLAASQASAIEQRLAQAASAAYLLVHEVKRNRGQIEGFERYAETILHSIDGIDNLQLAPQGVIQRIYPLAGNERAIGLDILKLPYTQAIAQQAIEDKKLTVTGPYQLVQGGVGIVGRQPVFMQNGQTETFWGFVHVLILLSDVIAATKLEQLLDQGYQFQLSKIIADQSQPFAGTDGSQLTQPLTVISDISVPNGLWRLRLYHLDTFDHELGYTLSFLIALALSVLVYRQLRLPEMLRQQVEQQTEALKTLAFHDHLTGLGNRRLLTAQLEQTILDIQRQRNRAALLYIDLDDFKRINDTLGHDAGDTLLQKISARVRNTVRRNDIIARLGGDEFAIILIDVDNTDSIRNIAGKLIQAIRQPVLIGEQEMVISCSIGITAMPQDGVDAESLTRNADLALYSAKNDGKNRYHFFDEDMHRQATQNLIVERGLRDAIEQRQFCLHFQPIMRLSDHSLRGYELLLRWNHPERGLLFPDAFIGVAESTRLIIPMGYWVIHQACAFLAAHSEPNQKPVQISVNLAPQQFTDPLLASRILSSLRETGANAEGLELEITETALMENIQNAIRVVRELRQAGVRIAMDDFGTGYSSLSLLNKLPIDTLKIDRSFIEGIEKDERKRQIVSAIIAMAKKLQLEIVGEGIETNDQRMFLFNNQVEYGQGYWFSKPVPETDIMRLIQRLTADLSPPVLADYSI